SIAVSTFNARSHTSAGMCCVVFSSMLSSVVTMKNFRVSFGAREWWPLPLLLVRVQLAYIRPGPARALPRLDYDPMRLPILGTDPVAPVANEDRPAIGSVLVLFHLQISGLAYILC